MFKCQKRRTWNYSHTARKRGALFQEFQENLSTKMFMTFFHEIKQMQRASSLNKCCIGSATGIHYVECNLHSLCHFIHFFIERQFIQQGPQVFSECLIAFKFVESCCMRDNCAFFLGAETFSEVWSSCNRVWPQSPGYWETATRPIMQV